MSGYHMYPVEKHLDYTEHMMHTVPNTIISFTVKCHHFMSRKLMPATEYLRNDLVCRTYSKCKSLKQHIFLPIRIFQLAGALSINPITPINLMGLKSY